MILLHNPGYLEKNEGVIVNSKFDLDIFKYTDAVTDS